MAGITAAELKIRVTGDTSDAEQKLATASQKLTTFGKQAGLAGVAMTTGLTLPFVAAAKEALDGAIGYESSMNLMQAVSGATAEEMALVSAKAKELGADMTLPATSAADAGKAMVELAKAGLSVQDSLAAARGVLQMSASANIDNARAAEIAANALNSFGLSGERAIFIADLFAAAANASSVEVTDVADAFKMASAVYSNFQGPVVGAEQAVVDLTSAIALMGNAGVKGSDAGTSLKQALLMLTGPSDKAKRQMEALYLAAMSGGKGMEYLDTVLNGSAKEANAALDAMRNAAGVTGSVGDIAYDASGKMRPFGETIRLVAAATRDMTDEQRNAAITTIFGADASRAVLTLMRATTEEAAAQGKSWDDMAESITRQGAAADLAGARMKGLGGALQGFQSTVETVGLSASEKFLPVLEGMVRGAADLVQGVSEAPPELLAFAGTFTAVLVAAGPVLGVIGGIAGAIGFMLTPLGAAIVSVALLTAAFVAGKAWLDEHKEAQAALVGVVTALATAFTLAKGAALAHAVQMGLTQAATGLLTAAQWALNAALNANPIAIVITLFAGLAAAVIYLWNTNEDFRNAVLGFWNSIQQGATELKDNVGRAFGLMGDKIGQVWEDTKRAARDAVNGMIGFVNRLIGAWNSIEFRVPEIRFPEVEIMGQRFGGGSWGGFTVGVPKLSTIPALAEGGFAFAGQPYLVGERGPELFVPRQTGYVLPHGGFDYDRLGEAIAARVRPSLTVEATINSPAPLSPLEVRRQTERMLRNLALEYGYA